jgi:hypothetical protein
MSNIVGEGFDPIIIKQIDQRQKVYGSANRTNEQLSYLNARTGWVRLVSSVDLIDSDIRGGFGVGGSNLAKENVLFNGTTTQKPVTGSNGEIISNNYSRGGIWDGASTIGGKEYDQPYNYYAYGMGGTDYGLRPMPGIKSATIKTETRGSIKTAEVKIQANNRQQFDIIDLLYMRLGFSILLEWGNSSYFDNSEPPKYIASNPYTLSDEFLLGKLQYNTIYKKIQEKRLASCGNYDALMGKVVNFSWNFTKDLTYEITLKIISMGDVIESLKTNALLPGGSLDNSSNTNSVKPTDKAPAPGGTNQIAPQGTSTQPAPAEESVIKDFANVHEVGAMFYQKQQELALKPPGDSGMSTLIESDLEYSGRDSGDSVYAFKQVYQDKGATQYYIRLGWFLKWIEKNLIPKVDSGNNDINNEITLLKINNKVRSNIIYLLGRQLSTDPGICLFKKTIPTTNGFIQFASDADQFYTPSVDGNSYGYIMNAYFNMTYILTQMNSLKNKDGKFPLYDLLECLCKGWNQATGNFNDLTPVIDSETEYEIKFVDSVILPNKNEFLKDLERSTELANFNIQGYYFNPNGSSTGGFVRDLSFTTTVPPNLANMLTVGATSQGYVVGQDATAISRMNNGLEDRFKKSLKTKGTTQSLPSSASLLQDYAGPINSYNVFLRDLGSWKGQEYPKWNQEAINAFSNTATTFYEYDQAKQTIAAQEKKETDGKSKNKFAASPNSGFLPFDLSIKMDGLSGMKVYQKYIIDTAYLPTNYPNSLEFIIKGISNTIENNEWTTTLDSMAIPKNPFGSSVAESSVEQASQKPKTKRTRGTGNSNAVRGNADLRQILITAGYAEGTAAYQFAYSIGTKEGWNATANGGRGTRAYRNNNPGNLDYSDSLKAIDPGVTLENNPYGPDRFAHFTTAELGAKALVETKIKSWANGRMPITTGNQSIIVSYKGGNKYKQGTNPTLAQFFFTYAPPTDGNNTEKYITDVIRDLSKIKPGINRNTLVKDILA